MSPTTSATGPARLAWLDVARGISILLVVLLHTQGALTAVGFDHPALTSLNVALATLRMPTFFLVSGLVAARAIGAPGHFVRRPVRFAYLYVVWSGLFVLVAAAVGSPEAALDDALGVDGVLWYFAALAVYLTAARLTRRVPVPVQLAVATALWLPWALGVVSTGSWGADHILQLYVFFLVGAHFRDGVLAFATTARPGRCALLLLAWAALGLAVRAVDPSGRLLFAVLPPVAVAAVVQLSVLLTGPGVVGTRLVGTRLVGTGLERLGRATLPVYVLHPLVLALAVAPALRGGVAVGPLPLAVQALGVLVATVVVVAVSGLAGRGLVRLPWLVDLPVRRRPPAAVRDPGSGDRCERDTGAVRETAMSRPPRSRTVDRSDGGAGAPGAAVSSPSSRSRRLGRVDDEV